MINRVLSVIVAHLPAGHTCAFVSELVVANGPPSASEKLQPPFPFHRRGAIWLHQSDSPQLRVLLYIVVDIGALDN